MSKIKAVVYVTTSNFCKGKPYPDPKFAAFWDVIPWSLLKKCWHFKGPCFLQHHNTHRPSALTMDVAD